MSVKIIVDTASQYTKEIGEKNGITVIPMPVISAKDNKEYFTGDIDAQQFYENMLNKQVYTTAQVGISTYLKYFEEFYKNKQEAIYFSLSSGLSSTYDTSLMAINELNEKYKKQYVYSYDSRMATAGIDLVVSKVLNGANNGMTIEQLIKIADDTLTKICAYVAVTDLEYLYRGGRISKTTAFVANALSLKPIIEMKTSTGKLHMIDKVRGYKKLAKYFVEKAQSDCNGAPVAPIYLCNCLDTELIYEIKDKFMSEFGFKDRDFIVDSTCIIIGCHTGPGSVYVFYLKEEVGI